MSKFEPHQRYFVIFGIVTAVIYGFFMRKVGIGVVTLPNGSGAIFSCGAMTFVGGVAGIFCLAAAFQMVCRAHPVITRDKFLASLYVFIMGAISWVPLYYALFVK